MYELLPPPIPGEEGLAKGLRGPFKTNLFVPSCGFPFFFLDSVMITSNGFRVSLQRVLEVHAACVTRFEGFTQRVSGVPCSTLQVVPTTC